VLALLVLPRLMHRGRRWHSAERAQSHA
jgi:hypothetical protein